MPTILHIKGWRIFFYSNENKEYMHVHCRKGNAECKYWIFYDEFDIEEAYSYNLTAGQKREIRKIIFEHMDYIKEAWDEFQNEK